MAHNVRLYFTVYRDFETQDTPGFSKLGVVTGGFAAYSTVLNPTANQCQQVKDYRRSLNLLTLHCE
jgi:hypothetical protein